MSADPISRWRGLTQPTATAAPRSASNAWWGMALVVATEATLFAVMLASYFYVRWRTEGGWPPGGKPPPELLRPSLIAGALVLSAAPMAFAEAAIRRGSTRRLIVGLLGTLLGAAAFLALQSIDYVAKLPASAPQDDAYESLTYAITGAHAVHVAIGVLLLLWIGGRALAGAYDERRHVGVDVVALYWYFLVVVEIAIYLSLFISVQPS